MITILVIACTRSEAEWWMRKTNWSPPIGKSYRVIYASEPHKILGLDGATTYYVCTGRWWARPSAQQALIEAKRRGARELDDVVSLLGSLVSADLGSGNTGPPSVLP